VPGISLKLCRSGDQYDLGDLAVFFVDARACSSPGFAAGDGGVSLPRLPDRGVPLPEIAAAGLPPAGPLHGQGSGGPGGGGAGASGTLGPRRDPGNGPDRPPVPPGGIHAQAWPREGTKK